MFMQVIHCCSISICHCSHIKYLWLGILNWIGIFYFSDIVCQLIEEQIRCYNQALSPGSNTIAVIACSEYLFPDMSQAITFDRWQSMTLADIWTSLAEIASGPVALLVSKDLTILLISFAVGFGRSNLLSVLKTLFIFWMLGWLLYTDIISLTVSSS